MAANRTTSLRALPSRPMRTSNPLSIVPESTPSAQLGAPMPAPPVADRILALEDRIRAHYVGHEEAVEEILACYSRWLAGLAPTGRPAGIYMLVGSTGSGKTELVYALARALNGVRNTVVRIDGGEYRESHEAARLVGAPPGYLGHRETVAAMAGKSVYRHTTTDQRLALVLIDEVDKMAPRCLDTFLGAFDYGNLTLGDGSTTDFTNTIFFLTSNIGSSEIQAALEGAYGLHGPTQRPSDLAAMSERHARRGLRPELYNRLDRVLAFPQLTASEIASILQLELNELEERMAAGPRVVLTISPEAKALIAADSFEPKYGARHLKRAIRRLVEVPLSNLVIGDQAPPGSTVRIGVEAGALTFKL